MKNDIDPINVMKSLSFFNLKIWLLANVIAIGSAFDETNQGCYLDTNGKQWGRSQTTFTKGGG